jgi:hypothetical protein
LKINQTSPNTSGNSTPSSQNPNSSPPAVVVPIVP